MQTKKIIGIALAVALLGSMATVAVAARNAVPDEELGGMTSWAEETPDEPTETPDEPTETPDEPTETPDEPTETPDEPTEES